MKSVKIVSILLLSFAIPAGGIRAQELDEHLHLMKPFAGRVWEGKMQGLRGEGVLTSQREWRVVWGGKAIKYTSHTDKLDVYQEGYFFWDPEEQEIGMFTLNSEGRFQQGHVKQDGGKIRMYGALTLEGRRLEYRNYFEFTEDGKLLDNWFSFEDGEWRPGHSVEWYEKKTQSAGPRSVRQRDSARPKATSVRLVGSGRPASGILLESQPARLRNSCRSSSAS
jgi:hypothetical protein